MAVKTRKVLLRIPEELAEVLDARVAAWRQDGVPATRTFVMTKALEEHLLLLEGVQ